jgi:ubiquinone/menaquinone biosynthesis C-methylase UbiE
VLDLGAGTGRLTCIIAPKAKSMIATDASAPMLDITERKLKELELPNHLHWKTIVADHRQLPIDDNSVDVIVSGWSICYLASSNHHLWDNNLEEMMQEARRVLRPGGKIIIFETISGGLC